MNIKLNSLRYLKNKIVSSRGYRWHKEFLEEEEIDNFNAYLLATIGMFFGHILSPQNIIFFSILFYAGLFWSWTFRKGEHWIRKPPWKTEKDQFAETEARL